MASADAWTDFEQIRHAVKQNTVDKLKQIITGLNEECGTSLPKSGKKQDIIDRIGFQLDHWRATRMEDKWLKAKNILSQVRSYGSYTTSRASATPLSAGLPQVPGYHSYNVNPKVSTYSALGSGSSTPANRYDPYAPPRKPPVPAVGSSSSSAPRNPSIRFKDSPFFQIDQQVSTIIECPESTSANDRRQQILTFTLNSDQIAKLKQDNSNYQLRLFCTSSVFYTPSTPLAFRHNLAPCPVEFPPTCEVRVNNTQLSANLKGLKKKPGTAPPPDLGKLVRCSPQPNRVEMVYVNSTQPVQSKKFYLVVMLVQATSVDKLVENLQANSRRSNYEIKQKMLESMSDDDDIQAGPQKMSLKCPLSYMRVNTPCRSSKCVHSQCFDATSWFSMMEQTTTYLCPTCERTLDHKDLIIDGYFDEILKETPESVEDVIVEADGEWHTSDNKYGSAKWKALNPIIPKTATPSRQPNYTAVRPVSSMPSEDKGKGKAAAEVVVLLDSEDEEEGQVKRELSPSTSRSLDSLGFSAQSSNQQSHLASEVIDLTLDDDEDQTPPPPRPANKRTAESADLPDYHPTDTWKKNRTEVDHQHRPPQIVYQGSNHVEPRVHAPLPSLNGYAPPPPRAPPAALTFSNYPSRQSLTESRQLPPINYNLPSRPNGGGPPRWS